MGYFGIDGSTKRGSSCQTHPARECFGKQFDPRHSGCRLFSLGTKGGLIFNPSVGRAAGICRRFLCLRTASGKRDCSGPWTQACVHYRRRGFGKKSRIAIISLRPASLGLRRWVQERLNRPHSLCKFPKQSYHRDC